MRCIVIVKEGRRHRYIGFKISPKNEIKRYEITSILKSKCQDLFEKDYKDMGMYLTRYNGEIGIVRCRHIEKDNIITLLNSIESINSKDVKIKTVATSGTIKALIRKHFDEKLINH